MNVNKNLKHIIEAHHKWICDEDGGARADLRIANLRRADLSEADLRGADLRGADLRGADLSDADLSEADLSEAKLNKADLRGADLRGADLRIADLRGADLSVADLSGADLSGAKLNKADLREADLSGTDLSGADLSGADLRGTNLSMAKNLLFAIDYIRDTFETSDKGVIAYKTFGGAYTPPKGWIIEPGGILTENCNMNRTETCGCGINVATLEWVKKNYTGAIWQVLIRWEWLCGVCVPYNTDGKIRCEMVELIGIVKEE